MKLLAVACLTAVVTIDAGPAAACSPPLSCGDQYCFASSTPPDAVIEGVLVEASGSESATVDVTAVSGAPELQLGEATLSLDPSVFVFEEEVGETVLLYLRRAPDGELFATKRIERAGLDECFASNEIAVADLATIVLAPQCREQLNANEEPFEGCGDEGPAGCSAGGGSAGALVLLALIGIRAPSRRRRS